MQYIYCNLYSIAPSVTRNLPIFCSNKNPFDVRTKGKMLPPDLMHLTSYHHSKKVDLRKS